MANLPFEINITSLVRRQHFEVFVRLDLFIPSDVSSHISETRKETVKLYRANI